MNCLAICLALLVTFTAGMGSSPHVAWAECLIPPGYDPGVGELYVCSPVAGERYLIEYTRRSHRESGLREDIWLNFRGVFADQVWINVGTREANDTSLPAWEVIATLVEQMRAIKAGERSALQQFLAPFETAPANSREDRSLKLRLLETLRESAAVPARAPVRAVLYHVHLKPTREIEEQSLMPINHALSIPSHTDLLYAPKLAALTPGAESKIAVPAGIWAYELDETQAARFVANQYDGSEEAPFALKFGHVYTRFAITEYQRQGLNDPAKVTPERVSGYIATLRSTGAILHFAFADDWIAARETLTRSIQKLGTPSVGTGGSRRADGEADLVRGREVYEANCAICHGVRGDGKGMAAHHFRTKPQNFRTGRFKFRSTPSGSLPLDKDLFRTITEGVGRTGMIPQIHLDEGDRWAVVSYLKTFSPRFQRERAAPAIAIPPAPNRTPDLETWGRRMYMDAGCSDCHGLEGRGDGPSAGQLRDEWGNPIAPADLIRLPRKSGPTPRDLYRTIATGLDGTPMPSYSDALTPEEMWAVVAYLDGLPPKDEWGNLGKLVDEEIIGFNVERMHRRPLPATTPKGGQSG